MGSLLTNDGGISGFKAVGTEPPQETRLSNAGVAHNHNLECDVRVDKNALHKLQRLHGAITQETVNEDRNRKSASNLPLATS